jgi:hypothetical protein
MMDGKRVFSYFECVYYCFELQSPISSLPSIRSGAWDTTAIGTLSNRTGIVKYLIPFYDCHSLATTN